MHLLPVAPPAGTSEVETLDSSKAGLCRGLKDGFAAAWDALAPEDLAREFPGAVIAARLFDAESIAAFDVAFAELSAMVQARGVAGEVLGAGDGAVEAAGAAA